MDESNKIDIFEICAKLWKMFRKIWWLVLALIVLGASIGIFREKMSYRKQYEASASFIVSTGGNNSMTSYYNKVTMEQMSATFPYILTSGVLHQIVANDMGLASVPGVISANVLEETNLFQIRVVSSEPQMAYDVLQSVIKNYLKVAKYVIGDTTLKLIDESGVPEAPMTQPRYKVMAVKGALGGCLVSMVILFLGVALTHTVKDKEDIKKVLNVKCLAGIPMEHMKKRSKKAKSSVMIDRAEVSYVFKEALNTLQIRLNREMKEHQMKTVLVTSTLAGEGKTTISCNLAQTMASKGYKVLLVDADFRNPSVGRTLQLAREGKGLEDLLLGNAKLDEVLCKYGENNLWVLPVLKAQDKVARLYRNGRFKVLLQRYAEEMDIILIDTPPCGIMNDAALVGEYVDGVLLVIRQDYAQIHQILEGVEIFSGDHAQLVGCVINGEETGIGSYGYGKYGYGKYGYGRYGYGKYGYGRYGYGEKEEKN